MKEPKKSAELQRLESMIRTDEPDTTIKPIRPMDMKPIVIDPEFRDQIPPLSELERVQLEGNIIANGCRDGLCVWETDAALILLDGHNRYGICQDNNVPFTWIVIPVADRKSAADWIDRNQLGRRNLPPDQMSLIRGRIYNRVKGVQGGDRKSKGQNDPLNAAATLAKEHGVSEKTIKRDGQFAKAVETLKPIIPDIAEKIAKGAGPSKKQVLKAAGQATNPTAARAELAKPPEKKRVVTSSLTVTQASDDEIFRKLEIIGETSQTAESIAKTLGCDFEAAIAFIRECQNVKGVSTNRTGCEGGTLYSFHVTRPSVPESGKGVDLANEAINYLKRIPKNDKLRGRGFEIVEDWIASCLGEDTKAPAQTHQLTGQSRAEAVAADVASMTEHITDFVESLDPEHRPMVATALEKIIRDIRGLPAVLTKPLSTDEQLRKNLAQAKAGVELLLKNRTTR